MCAIKRGTIQLLFARHICVHFLVCSSAAAPLDENEMRNGELQWQLISHVRVIVVLK